VKRSVVSGEVQIQLVMPMGFMGGDITLKVGSGLKAQGSRLRQDLRYCAGGFCVSPEP
jgi:hypothetical protein